MPFTVETGFIPAHGEKSYGTIIPWFPGFISNVKKPAIIDEAQRVPQLILAIKEEVDRNRTAGRYLLTGSANILTLPRVADSLAGVVICTGDRLVAFGNNLFAVPVFALWA